MTAVPQGKLDPSAVIGEAFDIYKKNLGVLLPAALAIFAVQAVAVLLLNGSLVAALLLNIISAALSYIYTGGVVQLVRDVQDGQLDSSIGQIVQSVLPVLVPLILVSIIAGIIIGVGFILIIAPGLYAATIFAVVGPVTVVEKPGVFAALGRSQNLVKGSGWQVFGVIVFVFALSILAGIIAGIIGAPLGTGGKVLVQWISSSLLAPAGALATAVTYLRLRELKGEPPVSTTLPGTPAI